MKTGKIKVSYNSPVILGFSFLCLIALFLEIITGGKTNQLLFSVYRSSLYNPLTYIRMFGHVLGHADWEHFVGNITLILVIGPMLEEKYGSSNILFVILVTALLTGVVNYLFFAHVRLLGASGIVFAFIILSSLTSIQDGMIPLTFLVVFIVYIGGQVFDGIVLRDNIANLTHILGGITGAGLGYYMNKHRMNRY
ncbi:MAG: rhomboid family intramembrane serine protease [Lachnospiraceae bacterium]